MEQLQFNEDYVRRLAAGDPVVQAHFIEYFGLLLRAKLRTRLRSPELIEDARQETFLRVLQTVKRKDGNGGLRNAESLPAYVNSVCHNVVLESLRSATRHSQIPEEFRELIDESADSAKGVVTEERKKLVTRVLEELPEKDREVLTQLFLHEKEKAEVCKTMNISSEYLRVLLYRAKRRFRSLL